MESDDPNIEFYREVERVQIIENEILTQFKEEEDFFSGKSMFHYTSAEGLIGILHKEAITLWFSQYNCLNDRNEGKLVYSCYDEVLEQMHAKHDISEDFYNRVKSIRFKFIDFFICDVKAPNAKSGKIEKKKCHVPLEYQAFLCCFSLNRDSLSTWNYYSKENSCKGYNIGLQAEQFLNKHKPTGCCSLELRKVIYGAEWLRDSIKKLITDVYKRSDELGVDGIVSVIADQLYEWLLVVKDACYNHEQEVRAILKVPCIIPKEVIEKELARGARSCSDYIVPYVECEFDKDILETITTGPLLDKDTAKMGVRSLLDMNNFKKEIEILPSEIPIRY